MTVEEMLFYGTCAGVLAGILNLLVSPGLDILRTIAIGLGFILLLAFWFVVILPGVVD